MADDDRTERTRNDGADDERGGERRTRRRRSDAATDGRHETDEQKRTARVSGPDAGPTASRLMSAYSRPAWHRWYLLLAASSIALVALVASDVQPFALLSPLSAAAVVVAAMLVTSTVHHLLERGGRDPPGRL